MSVGCEGNNETIPNGQRGQEESVQGTWRATTVWSLVGKSTLLCGKPRRKPYQVSLLGQGSDKCVAEDKQALTRGWMWRIHSTARGRNWFLITNFKAPMTNGNLLSHIRSTKFSPIHNLQVHYKLCWQQHCQSRINFCRNTSVDKGSN